MTTISGYPLTYNPHSYLQRPLRELWCALPQPQALEKFLHENPCVLGSFHPIYDLDNKPLQNPLHRALAEGHYESALILVDRLEKIDPWDQDETSPLGYIAFYPDKKADLQLPKVRELVKCLLLRGARYECLLARKDVPTQEITQCDPPTAAAMWCDLERATLIRSVLEEIRTDAAALQRLVYNNLYDAYYGAPRDKVGQITSTIAGYLKD